MTIFDAGTLGKFLDAIQAKQWRDASTHADTLRAQGWTHKRLMDAARSDAGITSHDFETAMQEVDRVDLDDDLEGDAGLSGWMPAGSEADAMAIQAARKWRGERKTNETPPSDLESE